MFRLLAALVAVLALSGCSPEEPLPPAPPGVFEHAPAREDSVAVAATDGVTRPLRDAGWFCAQVRANADGRFLWCHAPQNGQAQFLLDPAGRLVRAWFPEDEVPAVAFRALSAVWPGAGERAAREIEEFGHTEYRERVTDGSPRTRWRDDHADYDYSVVNGLVVAARETDVRRWPYGAEHYATAMSAAVGDLKAGGYDCFYPPQTSCNRPQSNGYFRVTLRGDQIVSADFGIGSIVENGRQRHPLGQEFPHGLTFLTEEVRGPVTERIELSRRTGSSFAGVVAGTVVVIDARRGRVAGDDLTAYLDVRIGVPLPG